MAKITQDDILKLAKLARLHLTDNEVDKFQHEISDILSYVELLNDVDTNGLKPTNQVTGLSNVSRQDEVKNYGADKTELLKNAPNREKDYIKVKRMIG